MTGPPKRHSPLRVLRRPVCWLKEHQWVKAHVYGFTKSWEPTWVCERCEKTATPHPDDLNNTNTEWADD